MRPVLETGRLLLRDWREGDFDAFAAIYADAEQARFIGGACARADAWARMAAVVGHWHFRGYGVWALEEKATGDFCGWAGPWNPEGFPEQEIGWTLTRAAQGRGLATEAASRARRYAYEQLGWSTAISLIEPDNAASVRVAKRLGAAYERNLVHRAATCAVYRHPSAQRLRALAAA